MKNLGLLKQCQTKPYDSIIKKEYYLFPNYRIKKVNFFSVSLPCLKNFGY